MLGVRAKIAVNDTGVRLENKEETSSERDSLGSLEGKEGRAKTPKAEFHGKVFQAHGHAVRAELR